jgi:hypothetical protein
MQLDIDNHLRLQYLTHFRTNFWTEILTKIPLYFLSNLSIRTMALWLTQPLKGMSTRMFPEK